MSKKRSPSISILNRNDIKETKLLNSVIDVEFIIACWTSPKVQWLFACSKKANSFLRTKSVSFFPGFLSSLKYYKLMIFRIIQMFDLLPIFFVKRRFLPKIKVKFFESFFFTSNSHSRPFNCFGFKSHLCVRFCGILPKKKKKKKKSRKREIKFSTTFHSP